MSTFTEKTQSAKRGAKKFVRRLVIIIVLIFVGVMLFLHYATYSSGVRAGTVLKVSEKGAVFKTYEGQLDLQSFGAVESNNRLSQIFEFSIKKSNNEAYKALEDASLSGERVRIRYNEKYAKLFWLGETKYFVTEVEKARGGTQQQGNNGELFPE